jgi:hypothetical protein
MQTCSSFSHSINTAFNTLPNISFKILRISARLSSFSMKSILYNLPFMQPNQMEFKRPISGDNRDFWAPLTLFSSKDSLARFEACGPAFSACTISRQSEHIGNYRRVSERRSSHLQSLSNVALFGSMSTTWKPSVFHKIVSIPSGDDVMLWTRWTGIHRGEATVVRSPSKSGTDTRPTWRAKWIVGSDRFDESMMLVCFLNKTYIIAFYIPNPIFSIEFVGFKWQYRDYPGNLGSWVLVWSKKCPESIAS